jgi:hypothetical protein
MTTCVAGALGGGSAIGLVADKMLGSGDVESPVGYKILTLHRNWRVMYAGGDTAPARPIVARASADLDDTSRPSSYEVAAAIANSWKVERLKRAENRFLSPFNITMAQFYNEGKSRLTDVQFSKLFDEISETEIDLQLLIAGFDENKQPSIMAVDMDMRGMPDYMGNFAAIGSGMKSALMMLHWRNVLPTTPVREGIAYLVEAKLWGETAPSVSEETDVVIMRPDQGDIKMDDDDVEKVLFQRIAIPNQPRRLTNAHLLRLNELKDLKGFPYITRTKLSGPVTEAPFTAKNKPVRQPNDRRRRGDPPASPQSPPRPKRGQKAQPA